MEKLATLISKYFFILFKKNFFVSNYNQFPAQITVFRLDFHSIQNNMGDESINFSKETIDCIFETSKNYGLKINKLEKALKNMNKLYFSLLEKHEKLVAIIKEGKDPASIVYQELIKSFE